MPDYSKSKIYTIRCKADDTKIYVGSTIDLLTKRFSKHKKDSKKIDKYPKHKLYSIVENWNDWYIELYELFPCNSKEELHKREGEVIREIGTLNRCIAGRTFEEWKSENRELLLEKKREDWRKNADDYNLKRRTEKITCGCGSCVRKDSLTEHKKSKKHIQWEQSI